MKSLKTIIHTIRGKFSITPLVAKVALPLLTLSSLIFSPLNAAEIQEGDTPSMINSRFSIELNNHSTKMANRMMTWKHYNQEMRFYKHLQVQTTYAAKVATRLSGMEAVFSQVTEEKPRLHAMRLMYMHYKDAYDDLETRWNGTDDICKNNPSLKSPASEEVQALIAPYAIQWVKVRMESFEKELKQIDPEFKK